MQGDKSHEEFVKQKVVVECAKDGMVNTVQLEGGTVQQPQGDHDSFHGWWKLQLLLGLLAAAIVLAAIVVFSPPQALSTAYDSIGRAADRVRGHVRVPRGWGGGHGGGAQGEERQVPLLLAEEGAGLGATRVDAMKPVSELSTPTKEGGPRRGDGDAYGSPARSPGTPVL